MRDKILSNVEYDFSRNPIVKEYDYNQYNLDPDLRKLFYTMIKPTDNNREFAYWNDSISRSFSHITASTIIGDGLRINSTNQRAEDLIKQFNTQINVGKKSIEDYITHSWIDEIIHAGSYWRIIQNDDLETGVDIARIDPKTLKLRRDSSYGWRLYIQEVPNFKEYRSKRSFYRNANMREKYKTTYSNKTKEVRIPDEPDRLLRTSFFIKPPISSALHYITYKRWIAYFMRKYAQKHWAPFIVAMVGNPKTNYFPSDPAEMQESIDYVSKIIPDITNFGGVALPGDVSLETLDSGTAKSAEIYVKYMNEMDKQIMMSIFASMGLREASGTEKATQETLLESFLQFIKGVRRKYEIILKRFYAKGLCKLNDIAVSVKDIDIDFSPLRLESSLDLMKAIQIGVNTGVFENRNEARKAATTIYPWITQLDGDERIDFDLVQRKGISVKGSEVKSDPTLQP